MKSPLTHVGTLPTSTPHANYFVPGTHVALLTWTSKMGVWSFSLPARKTCPGAMFGAGYTCDSCYARKGQYRYSNVARAQQARLEWTVECMRTEAGRDAWVAHMVAAIRSESARFDLSLFRGHDSGDIYSVLYAGCWARVASELDETRFWFPTRSWRLPHMLRALQDFNALPNVVVSPSALKIDDAPPVVPGLSGGSMVTTSHDVPAGVHLCPASTQGGHCVNPVTGVRCVACYAFQPRAYVLH